MKRFSPLLVACMVLAAMGPARSELIAHPVAGRTIIHASGTSGVRLAIPRKVALAGNVRVEVLDGEATFVGLGGRYPDETCQVLWDHEACISGQGWFVRQYDTVHSTLSVGDPGTVEVGFLDIYVVTDGSVRIVIDLTSSGLSGQSGIVTDRPIDAVLKRLDKRCRDDACRISNGGATHRVRAPAFLSAYGYGGDGKGWTEEGGGNFGSTPIDVCIYPSPSWGSYDESPQPEDHPGGCDSSIDSIGNAGHDLDYAYWTASGGHSAVAMYEREGAGDEYIGFRGHAITAPNQVPYGAWGLWLNMGL